MPGNENGLKPGYAPSILSANLKRCSLLQCLLYRQAIHNQAAGADRQHSFQHRRQITLSAVIGFISSRDGYIPAAGHEQVFNMFAAKDENIRIGACPRICQIK